MHSQGNILAYAAFFIWIPVALWIARRWPPAKATALLFLVPLMFLPQRIEFKLPGLPEFEKSRITIFWILLALLFFHRKRIKALRLGKWVKAAIGVMLVSGAMTMFLNTDPVSTAGLYLAPHRPYDAVHSVLINLLDYILPFTLAAAMFTSQKDLRVFFRVLVGAALVYSLFQLVELRLSPQFNYWVYGFYQHSFRQTVRAGGYRPMVFMSHGLALAMFTFSGLLAAAALYKSKTKAPLIPAGWATAYLWVLLLLSKSIAAFLYSLVAVPLILFTSPKTQFRAAVALGLLVLLYPDFRAAGLVPVDDIKEWVSSEYGAEKVSSVMTRFENEEMLLERANERAFFGWGTYCRRCIHDPRTGETTSVTDGDWIKTWGKFGRIGFYSKYLLLLLPLFIAARRLKYIRRMSDRRLLAALGLILGVSVFNLVPNSEFNYLVFVFSGTLLGCTEGILRQQERQAAAARQAKAASSSNVDLMPAPAMISSCSGLR